jgi:hypothetical protein
LCRNFPLELAENFTKSIPKIASFGGIAMLDLHQFIADSERKLKDLEQARDLHQDDLERLAKIENEIKELRTIVGAYKSTLWTGQQA